MNRAFRIPAGLIGAVSGVYAITYVAVGAMADLALISKLQLGAAPLAGGALSAVLLRYAFRGAHVRKQVFSALMCGGVLGGVGFLIWLIAPFTVVSGMLQGYLLSAPLGIFVGIVVGFIIGGHRTRVASQDNCA